MPHPSPKAPPPEAGFLQEDGGTLNYRGAKDRRLNAILTVKCNSNEALGHGSLSPGTGFPYLISVSSPKNQGNGVCRALGSESPLLASGSVRWEGARGGSQ